MADPATAHDPHLDKDRRTLHTLGYAQEILRRMSGFSNFASRTCSTGS